MTLGSDRCLAPADRQLHDGVVLVDMGKAFDKVKH